MNYRFSEDAATTVIDWDVTTTNTDAGMTWVDMSGYERLTVYVFGTIGGGGFSTLKLQGSTVSGGTSPVDVLDNGSATPSTLGGYVILETSRDEIARVDDTLRYIGLNATHKQANDEHLVVFIRHGSHNKVTDLTSDALAS